MQEPALLHALGDVRGLRVLDRGCGDAAIWRTVLESGCRSHLGMTPRLGWSRPRETRFSAPRESFDLVISRMVLHYVEDLDAALSACRDRLVRGGRMVSTVVHPVVTSHDARASSDEQRTSRVVDDYFDEGPREVEWRGERVVWHDRTVERYVASFQRAGFRLAALSECAPRSERFGDEEAELARRTRIPLFLLLAGEHD